MWPKAGFPSSPIKQQNSWNSNPRGNGEKKERGASGKHYYSATEVTDLGGILLLSSKQTALVRLTTKKNPKQWPKRYREVCLRLKLTAPDQEVPYKVNDGVKLNSQRTNF